MKDESRLNSFFIGWDVGGWNCDKNKSSRDAIVILDSSCRSVGTPWRGNLRRDIVDSGSSSAWVSALFSRCAASLPNDNARITIAVDTPLGFSQEFIELVSSLSFTDPPEKSCMNHYLFRQTERFLALRGKNPLSSVKDMIGSQATKGMHAVAKFAPIVESCGIWSDGNSLRVIEAYPAACRTSDIIRSLLKDSGPLGDDDREDARTCAFVAYLIATSPEKLEAPPRDVPASEGWIWVPKEACP